MVDLNYDPASLCRPLDIGVVRFLVKYRGHKFDRAYLAHAQKWHGGVPGMQYFTAEDRKVYRVGRFLTLVDEKSKLTPPHRDSWEHPQRDARIDWSVLTLIDEEGRSCRTLFAGERLLPFAALYSGPHHPDKMSLTDGDVDLICFDYAPGAERPGVVLWLTQEAQGEYFRWERILRSDENGPVRYEDFTVPVARHFDAFLKLLRARR
jgi:hypothetical protein